MLGVDGWIVVGGEVVLKEKLYVAASCHVDVGYIPLPLAITHGKQTYAVWMLPLMVYEIL